MTKSQRNHIDLMTLVAVLVLMVLSLGVVYSASATWAMEKFGESNRLLNLHAMKVLLGLVALFVGMTIDYKKYKKLTKPAVILSIAFLMVTLVLGGEVKGATRWLRFGGLSLQPSEFAKFALLFHLCTLISTKGDLIRDFKKGFLPMMIWIGSVAGLVLIQPNFSTGSMIILMSMVMLFISRARFTHILGTVAAAIPVLVAVALTRPHVMQRIHMFMDGSSSGGKVGYQLMQGIIGFGNGGLFGVGPGLSKQRDFFLPESYGDFVFSIVGEEYGVIGTIFFMALFLVIMLRGFKIAKFARDEFGRLLAIGITSVVTLYALVNAGVTLGILPTTGLPMPFVSYGGSSLLFTSFAVGVLLNISAQTDMHPRAEKVQDKPVPAPPMDDKTVKVY
ncbi:MAG TPA: putative peptidoglycan glycosyltransferase FtsW [Bacteroidota bacterium]|nr:putative peptidoglycan glycosyltransferase FtsW [Bacteroidota bacterium]